MAPAPASGDTTPGPPRRSQIKGVERGGAVPKPSLKNATKSGRRNKSLGNKDASRAPFPGSAFPGFIPLPPHVDLAPLKLIFFGGREGARRRIWGERKGVKGKDEPEEKFGCGFPPGEKKNLEKNREKVELRWFFFSLGRR